MGNFRIPSPFRILAGILMSLLFATAVPAGGETAANRQPAWVEPGIDRPGSDFKILWLRGGPEPCQEACAQNPLCRSYSYVRAGVPGRMEGCWLKDGVPPAVEDDCCISGVKTGDTISRYLQETAKPVNPPAQAPPVVPDIRPPEPVPAEPVRAEERAPETGSARRGVEGLNYATAPPQIGESSGSGVSAAVSSQAAETGSGRRRTAGMDFSAAPPVPGSGARPPETVVEDVPAGATGRRAISGVHFAANPTAGEGGFAGRRPTGTATKRVGGVDLTAIPPQRQSTER